MKLFLTLTRTPGNKKTKNRNRAVGLRGEKAAVRFLVRKGYRILEKNARTFTGEIDIVARKKKTIVFAEVKTRKSLSFGPPYLAITHKKRRKLVQCALCYLKMKNMQNVSWRIDVISVELGGLMGLMKKIEHFENALEE